MRLSFYDNATTLDPLSLMILQETEDEYEADAEVDAIASYYEAGCHRRTVELNRLDD